MTKFTVVGSLNYDLVSYSERTPNAGETFNADSFETHIGGKGLNQTISIAKLLPKITDDDNHVRLIGHVGDDGFGRSLTQALENQNVDISNVEIVKGVSSGVAVIIVEKSTGENRILISAGANGKTRYSGDELDALFPNDGKEIVLFQNEIPGTVDTIEWLAANRPLKTIVYNPSPYYFYSTSIISMIDILLVNEGEAMAIAKDIIEPEVYEVFQKNIKNDLISGFSELALKLKSLINRKKTPIVVITLGPLGSVFTTFTASKPVSNIPAIEVSNIIDTTGAGDTFTGAFLTHVQANHNVGKAVEFASTASSLAIQKPGASDSIPTYAEVIQQIKT